ncbi:MAG TPA: flagellar biosynthetic protein FliO [Pyrinomonadaceae bacterium]|nr:flagellar biosynthetic protein FliO [Pyrinomonadaceae bacterium]
MIRAFDLLSHSASACALAALQAPTPFDPSGYNDSGASFFAMMVQTLLALALVCGLAYALFRWVLPRLQQVGGAAGSMVRIVDRTGLDARKSLYVIEVAGRWLLIASSEAGVQLISELDATSAEEAAQEAERLRPNFKQSTATARDAVAERFSRLLGKRK